MKRNISVVLGIALAMSLQASAVLVVDFTYGEGATSSAGVRASDSGGGASTTETWNFSDTTYFSDRPDAVNTNTSWYGGLNKQVTGITIADLSNDQERFQGTTFRTRYLYNADVVGTRTIAFQGAYIWSKADFLSNTNDQLQLSTGDSMSLVTVSSGNTQEIRMVVKQGGVYYASQTTGSGDFTINDFDTETWGVLDTNDYSVGAFSSLSITNIEAVGITFNYFTESTDNANAVAQMNFDDFQVNASLSGGPVYQPIDLANIITSGCVLQRDEPVKIWGTATPGETVTVEVKSQIVQTVVDSGGNWLVELDAEPAGGPYTMTISSAGVDPVVLTDIYFGDVWILTGQSNMFNQIQGIRPTSQGYHYYPYDPPNATDNFQDMRYVIVDTIKSSTPVEDSQMGPWLPWTQASGRLGNMSVIGYFFARYLNDFFDANGMADVPIGIVKVCRGSTTAEQWISPEAIAAAPESIIVKNQDQIDSRSDYYNGMIDHIQNYAIKGALWYQGEGNSHTVDRAQQYDYVKRLLIESWRAEWGIDFPFYFVQLAPHHNFTPIPADYDYSKQGEPGNWAWIRESQTQTLAVPNTKMACIIDIGFQGNIHPPYKDIVGERLARIALADTYGFDLVTRGPTVSSFDIEGSSVVITFENVADGLQTQAVDAQYNSEEIADGRLPISVSENVLAGFALCGSDQTFYWATEAEIISTNQVRISNAIDVPNPAHVRYAWQGFPMCNLFNSAGLPAEPFRTDDYAHGTSFGGEVTAPALTASMTATNVMVEWPPVSADWTLETIGNLTNNSWTGIANTNSYTSETVPLQDTGFFRLRK